MTKSSSRNTKKTDQKRRIHTGDKKVAKTSDACVERRPLQGDRTQILNLLTRQILEDDNLANDLAFVQLIKKRMLGGMYHRSTETIIKVSPEEQRQAVIDLYSTLESAHKERLDWLKRSSLCDRLIEKVLRKAEAGDTLSVRTLLYTAECAISSLNHLKETQPEQLKNLAKKQGKWPVLASRTRHADVAQDAWLSWLCLGENEKAIVNSSAVDKHFHRPDQTRKQKAATDQTIEAVLLIEYIRQMSRMCNMLSLSNDPSIRAASLREQLVDLLPDAAFLRTLDRLPDLDSSEASLAAWGKAVRKLIEFRHGGNLENHEDLRPLGEHRMNHTSGKIWNEDGTESYSERRQQTNVRAPILAAIMRALRQIANNPHHNEPSLSKKTARAPRSTKR